VDIATAPELQRSLEELVREGHTRLLVDMTDVLFMDSTGLGMLFAINKQLRGRRGRLAVLCPDPVMHELFELVGHNLLFRVETKLEPALRHLSPSRRFARRGEDSAHERRGSAPPAA
jgi:anti-sigma B factor antagonist